MPKNNSHINNNISSNTNKNNEGRSVIHSRTGKQGKKQNSNTDNTEVMRIDHIEVTDEVLTDRSGLLLFARYLSKINIYPLINKYFSNMRKSKKGIPIDELFKQLFCYFLDGTSLHLIRFDEIKADDGYAETIESKRERMLSSHSAKRFFKSFSPVRIWKLRKLLQDLFIWRLNIEKPSIVILGIDTTVLDNDDAVKREGVKYTYKKTKGFQPLLIYYGSYVIDSVFRGGDKHSNYKDTVVKSIYHIAERIRKEYRADVPIILRSDAGFFDQKNFEAFEEMHIGYICGGRVYNDIREKADRLNVLNASFHKYYDREGKTVWKYTEFMDKRENWEKPRRAIYMRTDANSSEGGLTLFFTGKDSIIYTNIGIQEEVNSLLVNSGNKRYLKTDKIIETYHSRGNDELINRYIKEFGTEHMPFKRFLPNAAFYYIMCLSFFLYESFKRDVLDSTSASISPTIFRRRFIDFAARITHTGRKIILKITRWVWKRINILYLWERCNNPPAISTA